MSEFRDPFKACSLYLDNDLTDSDDSDVLWTAFPGHRDTLALLHLRRHDTPPAPTPVPVPSELLQQIYQHLDPLDFHSARHTCRKWFLASLNKILLQKMTRRAGCSRAADEDSQRLNSSSELRRVSIEHRGSMEHANQQISDCHAYDSETSISDEWLLSKRLATEARITPGRHLEESSMTVRENLDFRNLLDVAIPNAMAPTHQFTVSSCGKFMLLNCAQIVYLYALLPSSTRLITIVCCRRRVLAVSMDTSSNRYSIAVLLEGRIGMCWDLSQNAVQSAELSTGAPMNAVATREAGHTSTVYEQLGTPGDPPRSVAICPQRKCVAFGCRMGIELHWTDALTGGDLNRWFPLAAPSDFLFFLPQRCGDTKKLRLISSARGSDAGMTACDIRSSVSASVTTSMPGAEAPASMNRLFFGSMSATTSTVPNIWLSATDTRQGVLRTVDCDHYRAIPLSDGVHVLFTDPTSGLLCLGSDAPLGGPTKLIRKFVFLPPGYVSTTTKLLPTCYSAGSNLQWGVRVVATYADGSLVLFNVPSDCFHYVKEVRKTLDVWDEQAGVFAQSDLLMDVLMDIQHTTDQTTLDNPDAEIHSQTHTHTRPVRTIQVPGVRVAILAGSNPVEDIAVLCQEGGLRIWTYTSGHAQCWSISMTRSDFIKVRHVRSDGLVEDGVNGKARDVSRSIHVHFGGVDGSEEQSAASKRPKLTNQDRVAASFIENIHHHHRSFSMGTMSQTFWKDFPCDDELVSCLAYRRMVFETMGRGTSSFTSAGSLGSRRKSES